MPMFRKKPVEIEARRYPKFPGEGLSDASHDAYDERVRHLTEWAGARFDGATYEIVIETLEGEMHAIEGDWIIRGVKGEFYPCKPDIFEATYDAL